MFELVCSFVRYEECLYPYRVGFSSASCKLIDYENSALCLFIHRSVLMEGYCSSGVLVSFNKCMVLFYEYRQYLKRIAIIILAKSNKMFLDSMIIIVRLNT